MPLSLGATFVLVEGCGSLIMTVGEAWGDLLQRWSYVIEGDKATAFLGKEVEEGR